jgi:hypothetical protein
VELRSADGVPVDGVLLAERQVLDRELAWLPIMKGRSQSQVE